MLGHCLNNRCIDDSFTGVDTTTVVEPVVVSDCTLPLSDAAVPDGTSCFSHELQGFGTCAGSRCAPRCIDTGDCKMLASQLDTLDAGTQGCESKAGYVGVCEPQALDP
jgi:hypothetical protein